VILTRERILEEYAAGRIAIDPFEPELVSVNSVDVRLGRDMWELHHNHDEVVRDLYNGPGGVWSETQKCYAGELREHPEYAHWAEGVVPDEADVFLLRSGGFYIATSFERIGTRNDRLGGPQIVPEMRAKSTVGRHGLTVALCAGIGDVGYCSRWALEIRVALPHMGNQQDGHPLIPLAVGTPVGQVVFHETTPTNEEYGGVARYQPAGGAYDVRFLPKNLRWFADELEPLL